MQPDYLHSSISTSSLQKSTSVVSSDSLRITGAAASTVGGGASSCASSAAVTPATASPDIDAMMTYRTDVRQLLSSGGASPGIWRPSRFQAMQIHHPPPPPPAVITYAEKPVHVDENKEAAKSAVSSSLSSVVQLLGSLTIHNQRLIMNQVDLICSQLSSLDTNRPRVFPSHLLSFLVSLSLCWRNHLVSPRVRAA